MSIATDIQTIEAKIKTEIDAVGGKLDDILNSDIEPLVDQVIQDLEAAAGPILEAAWTQVLAMIATKIAQAVTPPPPAPPTPPAA